MDPIAPSWQVVALFLLLGALALLLPLGRYARRIGEPPRRWILMVVMVWSAGWLVHRALRRFELLELNTPTGFWISALSLPVFALITYLGAWYLLVRRRRKNIANKIDEIGRSPRREN